MDNQERSSRTFGAHGRGTHGRRRHLASALLLGSAVSGLFGGLSAAPFMTTASADQPLSDNFFMPANRAARFLGIGYSDGYHAAAGRSNCSLLDLPPASAYANQPTRSHRVPAMFAMPAQAYDFAGPTWINGPASPAYQSFHQPAVTYPVQPSLPPQPSTQQFPAPTRTPTPDGKDRRDHGNNPKPESETIPAPKPRQTTTSPSDLLPDPPSSKFFDEDPTQTLLDGLEELGKETLLDPLMDDASTSNPDLRSEEANLDEDDLQLSPLIPPASDSKAFPRAAPSKTDLDLDLDLDLENFELPPATGDSGSLLDTRYRYNPYHPSSPQQYTPAQQQIAPQQARNNRLIAPANNQHTRVYEPSQVAPAVTRATQTTVPKQPRTASRIFEPRG